MTIAQMGRALTTRLQTQTFSALQKHPNYRLYWFGALISNVGTWMQMLAQPWLVYQLTHSAFYLGLVGFASSIPTLFLALFGGVLADRVERRRLMIGTQTGSMALAFTLAALTLTGMVTVWHIMVIAFLSGVVNALNTPVRQTIISDLVPKEDLMNAVAINSAQFQTSRMLGPAFAGAVLALVGPGWCFFVNGLSFLAVIGVLFAMRLPPRVVPVVQRSVWHNLTEGVGYVRRDATILALVGLAAVPALFAMPYMSLMPAFADTVLGADAGGLGILMSAAGAGALIGALAVASLGKTAPRGKLMLAAVIAFGAGLALFALSRSFALSVALLVCVGIASMSYNAINQTFLQTQCDDHMRGRVMSLLTLTTFGVQPFGQLVAGTVASAFGPPTAVLVGGSVCALFALWLFARRPHLRQLA